MIGDGHLWLDLRDPRLRLLLDGVVLTDDGTMRLATVPTAPETLGVPLDLPNAFAGPAGVAVGADGSVYAADPGQHRILVVRPCETNTRIFGCVRGPSSEPGQVDTPRGLAVDSRGRLFVADAGNDRIAIFDARSAQVAGVLDGFDDPWDLAVDGAGAIFVVEHGTKTIAKLSVEGARCTEFAATLAGQAVRPSDPGAIAVAMFGDAERLIVADGSQLICYELDGTYDDVRTKSFPAALAQALSASEHVDGLAATVGTLYVGASGGGVLSFTLAGTFLGRTAAYGAGASALAVDNLGRLVVHPGGGQLVRLAPDGTVTSGTFRIGPIACAHPAQRDVDWQRIHVDATVASGASVRLYALSTANNGDPPPLPAAGEAVAPPPTGVVARDHWRCAPGGALDLLALTEPAPQLWLGGELHAGDDGSTVITRVGVEYNQASWLQHLPAVFTRDDDSRALVGQLLALTRSVLDDREDEITALPLLFGAATATDTPPEGWLDWLAGWLGTELDERWSEKTRRAAVSQAFVRNARRGTAAGLRELIAVALGLEVRITEPGADASLWALGCAALGQSTQLAPGEVQGAVLATTATLGESHLIDDDERGASLFAEYANRFCVHVYAAQLRDDTLARLTELVRHEQPAESEAHVGVIWPRARVGRQATLGVDAIVGRGSRHWQLSGTGPGGLGHDTALPPQAAGQRAGVADMRVGQTTT
jgi:phage tail-like protein